MKKIICILSFCTLYFVLCTQANAQVLTFDRSYQDYQYNQTLYAQAYSDYQDAKNTYKLNQTLSLKEEARKKTFTMLVSRDQMIVVYLTTLRTKISELPSLSADYKNAIFGKIDGEVNFYLKHKESYRANDDLSSLFNTSNQSQNQYKDTTSLIVSEALFDISLGQEKEIRQNQEQIFSTLKSVINSGVADGKLRLDPFDHWFTDIETTDSLLKQNEDKAITQIQIMYSESYSTQGGYNSSIETLTSSISPLYQLNEFLVEVINYIKNQQ